MTNQTPLNPDALKVADEAMESRMKEFFAGLMTNGEMVDVIVSAYLTVAQPVVNSFDPRKLNRRGWTCGCEPGDYDKCEGCQSACDELADFLNRLEDTK